MDRVNLGIVTNSEHHPLQLIRSHQRSSLNQCLPLILDLAKGPFYKVRRVDKKSPLLRKISLARLIAFGALVILTIW